MRPFSFGKGYHSPEHINAMTIVGTAIGRPYFSFGAGKIKGEWNSPLHPQNEE